MVQHGDVTIICGQERGGHSRVPGVSAAMMMVIKYLEVLAHEAMRRRITVADAGLEDAVGTQA